MLFLWSINGQLHSVVDSIDTTSFDQFPNVILSLAFSTVILLILISKRRYVIYYNTNNLIQICSCMNGIQKMWLCVAVVMALYEYTAWSL